MMSFEQYRLLSVGMTELEVLALAGPAKMTFTDGSWCYQRHDGRLVALYFTEGRLIKIEEA
jgi:hypothetical protein